MAKKKTVEAPAEKMVTVRGVKYPVKQKFKRQAARELKSLLNAAKEEDFTVVWDLLELIVPTLPVEVLDDLDQDEALEAYYATEDDSGEELSVGE